MIQNLEPQIYGQNMNTIQNNLIDYHTYYTISEFDDKKESRYLYTYTITKEDYKISITN